MSMNTKNKLLIAVAAAALTAGSSIALAQAPGGEHNNPASKNAPAEKMAPPAKSNAVEQHGATNSPTRMGQENKSQNKSESQTTGQAPAQSNERMGQDKNKAPTTGQANEPTQRSTTGQGASEEHAAPKTDRLNNQANQPGRATTGQGASSGRGASVNLTVEQKTKIHDIVIKERSAPRVDHVDFRLDVGVAVPRTVRFAPLPTTIVEIEPTWSGFEYFLVGDQIVVVDPATLQIVAVLAA